MSTLTKASHQWMSRPDDERFTSLHAMHAHFVDQRNHSRELVVPSKKLTAVPASDTDHRELVITGPSGHGFAPTNWAFGQVCQRAGAPAGYLRELPAPLAADCINYGLQVAREEEEVGVLLFKNGDGIMRAATGPRYGRIWCSDVVSALVKQFGDGVTGEWRVPGEFGKAVKVDKQNTTLYAGDRDMFVFLADETNRIEIPNRRPGQSGSLARGFFIWNSEVGAATFGLGTFLFDYVCCNRIVWGAQGYQEIRIRHTSSAPERWLEEVRPALLTYQQSSNVGISTAIEAARKDRLDDKVDAFLAARFGARTAEKMKATHMLEEERPIETRWDAITAATAYARSIVWQDQRVELEAKAGALLTEGNKELKNAAAALADAF